jgi:hypothetical protein
MILLFRPPLAHGQLTFGSNELGTQGRAALEERADETQEIAEQFADASQGSPQVPEGVDNDIHAVLIAEETPNGNLP